MSKTRNLMRNVVKMRNPTSSLSVTSDSSALLPFRPSLSSLFISSYSTSTSINPFPNSPATSPESPQYHTSLDQDTGFNKEKRDALHLRGLIPAVHQSLELQVMRCLHQMRSKKTPLGKHIYLASLRQTNTRLFYAVVLAEPEEVLPLIYTPVVGEACQKFSQIYRRPEGLTISIEDKGSVKDVVSNWPVPSGAPRVAVMTDGSRILGLGDLGWNGLGIPIGKLSLYIAAGGLHPRSTIPIVLDVGTDTQKYLDDPLYLGLKRKRPSPEEYIEFVDEVMEALTTKYPNLIIQFEDFATERAFTFLERYKHTTTAWNDDIQGTGAVVLGAFAACARVASEAAKTPLQDQRILFFGAGSAGVGVAKQLLSFFRRLGLSEEEAKDRIWLVDSKGLVTNDRGDKLPEHKIYFSRSDNQGKQYKKLTDVIEYVKPTALIGLSTVPNTFDEDVIKLMSKINKRPCIMPLSNPVSLAECTFEQAVNWSDGQVVFAAGSPFAEIEYKGKRHIPAQANNLYIFPAIGLAGALCKAKRITDEMITESALALADALTEEEKKEGRLLPSLTRMREISRDLTARVIRMAERQKVTRDGGYTASKSDEELLDWIEGEMWTPSYDPLIA